MKNFLRPVYEERQTDPNTLGILILEKTNRNSPITDNFDMILLIIEEHTKEDWVVEHYEKKGETAAVHIIREATLLDWINTSSYRRGVEWVINGKVVLEKNNYVHQLKNTLKDFPIENRKLRKAIEFGKLIKTYNEVKALIASGNHKDAHSRVLYSLNYLARLAVIEKGYYPEVTVWDQIKKFDIEVYKLYEEFIVSSEELRKRNELMILAMDYVINHRVENSVEHLLDIMRTKDEPWSYAELKTNPLVQPYTLDLSSIISYLEEKEVLISVLDDLDRAGIQQRKYKLSDF